MTAYRKVHKDFNTVGEKGMDMCKNCGSTGKHKPFWMALGKRWCGHCGGRVIRG